MPASACKAWVREERSTGGLGRGDFVQPQGTLRQVAARGRCPPQQGSAGESATGVAEKDWNSSSSGFGVGKRIKLQAATVEEDGGLEVFEAAATLRANSSLIPLLRLRVADIETRLVDLTGNNRNIMQGLQAIAREKP